MPATILARADPLFGPKSLKTVTFVGKAVLNLRRPSRAQALVINLTAGGPGTAGKATVSAPLKLCRTSKSDGPYCSSKLMNCEGTPNSPAKLSSDTMSNDRDKV